MLILPSLSFSQSHRRFAFFWMTIATTWFLPFSGNSSIVLAQESISGSTSTTSLGRDFWVLEMPNYDCRGDHFAIAVANPASTHTQEANVVVEHQGTSFPMTVAPGTLETSLFPNCQDDRDQGRNSTLPVYHVTSSNVDVTVFAFNPLENVFTNDATLVLPTVTLGTSYRIVSYRSPTSNYRGSQFAIVATQTGTTTVEIQDPQGLVQEVVTLQQGERYLRVQDDPVMTGWLVNANQPVAVFSGTMCTAVGDSADACDILYEQVLPIQTLADTYVSCPTLTRPFNCSTMNNNNSCAGDVFQLMATQDGTEVIFSPPQPTVGDRVVLARAGDYVEYTSNVPHVVTATHPVYSSQLLVSQLSTGDAESTGDPALLAVPPVNQFLREYTFLTPTTFRYDYMHVIAPQGLVLTLDGHVQPPITCDDDNGAAGVVQDVTYCCARFAVGDGSHSVTGTDRFGLTVTGMDCAVSFAYVGGMGLEPINNGGGECATGGPYQESFCRSALDHATLELSAATASCGSDHTAPLAVHWSASEDGVTFSDASVLNPLVSMDNFGETSVCLQVTCGGTGEEDITTTCCSTVEFLPETEDNCIVTTPTPPGPIVDYSCGAESVQRCHDTFDSIADQVVGVNVDLACNSYHCAANPCIYQVSTTPECSEVVCQFNEALGGVGILFVKEEEAGVAAAQVCGTHESMCSILIAEFVSSYGAPFLYPDIDLSNQACDFYKSCVGDTLCDPRVYYNYVSCVGRTQGVCIAQMLAIAQIPGFY